jgi:hypothetical protein
MTVIRLSHFTIARADCVPHRMTAWLPMPLRLSTLQFPIIVQSLDIVSNAASLPRNLFVNSMNNCLT